MKTYEVERQKRLLKTPRMEVWEKTFTSEYGDSFTHTIIHSEPSVAIVLRKHGQIALICQLRSTTNQYHWEIPAGLKNEGEESIYDAAIREVAEETGYSVTDVEILVKGPSFLDPSKSDENFHVAVATAHTKTSQTLDEDERIDSEILWMDEKEVFKRLNAQMASGVPFFNNLYMTGHSMYALLAYFFLNKQGKI